MPNTDFLRRRNALWQELRRADPGTPDFEVSEFEAKVLELSALIGWNRARILAGLGLEEREVGASESPVQPD